MSKAPSKTIQTVAEYFSGIGLFRMGLEPLGWRVEFSNDLADRKYQMYEAFYPESHQHYVVDDVFHLDPSDIPETTLATCSFPCIDLSLAGNLGGINGRHSGAFWGFIRILEAQGDRSPPVVLIENVPGWLSSNGGEDFALTVRSIADLGYSCDVFVLDALSFVPQSRQRVFLVGTKQQAPESDLSRILARGSGLSTERLRKVIFNNRDLPWTYLEMPDPPPKIDSGLKQIIEKVPETDDRWWSIEEVDRHLAMMTDKHRERVHRLSKSRQTSYRTFYRRRRNGEQRAEVRRGDTAGCLRTAVGGSSRQFVIFMGGGRMRMRTMTPREYARLQGVPDRFSIAVGDNQALTGFGDAVCVPAISWIAQNVLAQLVEPQLELQ